MVSEQDLNAAEEPIEAITPSGAELFTCDWCGQYMPVDDLDFFAGSLHCKDGCKEYPNEQK